MPFTPWVRNISPLAWCLGASALANVITMIAALYLALSPPTINVRVRSGYVRATVDEPVEINDRTPVRVQIVK